MQKLSTGQPSTLGNYRRLAIRKWGRQSAAVKFLDYKIEAFGADEEVLLTERQALGFLKKVHKTTVKKRSN